MTAICIECGIEFDYEDVGQEFPPCLCEECDAECNGETEDEAVPPIGYA